jgi:hypothetical protein
MLIEEAQNELPNTLVVLLVLWLAILFLSFGLFAPRNATVVAALFLAMSGCRASRGTRAPHSAAAPIA